MASFHRGKTSSNFRWWIFRRQILNANLSPFTLFSILWARNEKLSLLVVVRGKPIHPSVTKNKLLCPGFHQTSSINNGIIVHNGWLNKTFFWHKMGKMTFMQNMSGQCLLQCVTIDQLDTRRKNTIILCKLHESK